MTEPFEPDPGYAGEGTGFEAEMFRYDEHAPAS